MPIPNHSCIKCVVYLAPEAVAQLDVPGNHFGAETFSAVLDWSGTLSLELICSPYDRVTHDSMIGHGTCICVKRGIAREAAEC